MAGLDMTSFAAALKIKYTPDRVQNMVYKKNPAFANVAKDEDARGSEIDVPIIFGNPQGRNAAFSTAQTKSTTSYTQVKKFQLTRVSDYGVAVVDNQTLEASQGNQYAFMKAVSTEIDGIINSLARSCAIAMYRAGWGMIGKIATIPGAVNIFTLTRPHDVTNFEIGQDLVFSSSESAAVLRSATPLTVTNVDRTSGTITLSGNLSTPGGVVNDTVFVSGDRQNSATPTMLKIAGFEAWVPSSTPGSTAFFGVDRSVDTRLGGLRYNGVGYPIEEALIEGASFAAREGAALDTYYLSFAQWSALGKALGSKVVYNDVKPTADIQFRSIVVHGPNGDIQVMADQNCPSDRIFGLQSDTWTLYSMGGVPRVLDPDGMDMLRQSTADGVEIRYGYYAQLGCKAPGYNINIQV